MTREEYNKIAKETISEAQIVLDSYVYKTAVVARALEFIKGVTAEDIDAMLDVSVRKYADIGKMSKEEICEELNTTFREMVLEGPAEDGEHDDR